MNTIYQHLTRCFLATFLLFSATTAAGPIEDLRVHDVLMSESVSTPVNSNGELIAFNLPLSAMGRDILLQLEPSRLNRIANLNGMQNQSFPFLYEGQVEGDANSWVRISVQNGKPSGYLFHYGKLLQLESRTHLNGLIEDTDIDSTFILIEPASSVKAAPLLKSLNLPTDIEQYAPAYKLSDDPLYQSKVHVKENANDLTYTDRKASQSNQFNFANQDILTRSITNRNALGTGVTRAMRIGIVVDSRFNEAHQNRGLARALSIINSVDAIYQSQLGIAIIVEGIRVYDDPATDPMRDNSGSVDEILGNFRPIRTADERLPNDLTLVHLFSGHRDPNRVIGLGWISTACRLDGYDLSMSTPFPFDALLAAHEIAHNLGALHDDNPQCTVGVSEQPNTLMWPELSGSSTATFSSCSILNMQASKHASCNIDNIDVGVRLRTLPSSESLRRSVVIQVTNKDTYQRPTELMSNTVFPIGTIIQDISAGCSVSGTTVNCNHGTLQANSNHSLSVSATLLSRSRENVLTTVELLNATDVNNTDNRAVIQLLNFDQTTGEAIAAESQAFDDPTVYQNVTVGGFGGMSATLLTTMLLFAVQRTALLRRRLRRYASLNKLR